MKLRDQALQVISAHTAIAIYVKLNKVQSLMIPDARKIHTQQ